MKDSKIKVFDLKSDLDKLALKINNMTLKKFIYQAQPIPCPVLVNITKRKEKQLIEDYLVIDQMIDEMVGDNFSVIWN